MSELLSSEVSETALELRETAAGHEVQTASYKLLFCRDSPYIELSDGNGQHWADLYSGSDVTTSHQATAAYEIGAPQLQRLDDHTEVRIASQTDDGPTIQIWRCYEDCVETYIETAVRAGIKSVRFFGGTTIGPNLFGLSMSQRHFEAVYNPQPSELEREVISALESTEITTSGMWKPGRRREFLLTPFCLGFSLLRPGESSADPPSDWLMASLSAPIEDQSMTAYRYEAHEDGFSLVVEYDDSLDSPTFRSPSLLLHFADNPQSGLRDFIHHATARGHLPTQQRRLSPAWHRGTTFVSWGSQLERQRDLASQAKATAARDLATEAFMTECLERLEAHDIHIDKLVIDDKWQSSYGLNSPDQSKWPDLGNFIASQHHLGRRTLLWLKLFDPEGLPPELCILDARGQPIASDPTNPQYLDCISEQIQRLLSPQHYDADGLKLDFLAQLPHGPGLRWHGKQRGHTALHQLMSSIYDSAKRAKPESLIQAHIVSPWFSQAVDQIRLNDTNEYRPIIESMGRRAALTASLLPHHSIDPDGWPMLDKASWRDYIAAQPDFAGTVTTHFVESVAGEPLNDADFAILAAAVRRVTR